MKVDLLQTFFTIYYPKIKQPFILLSGVGDLSPSINYKKFVDTEKIIKGRLESCSTTVTCEVGCDTLSIRTILSQVHMRNNYHEIL